MSLKKRFLLLGIIFAVFLISASWILIFSLGYKFDFASKKFIATGTLVVYSDPKGAEIFLNGKPTGKTTPATLRLLSPGEYDVRLEKPGYDVWEKHFAVIAKQVTWTSERDGKAILFLSNPVPVIVSESATDLFFADNAVWYSIATSTWKLYNPETQQEFSLKLKPKPNTAIKFSPDMNWAISYNADNVSAAEHLPSKETVEFERFNLPFTQAQPFGKRDLLLLTNDNRLYQYNIETKILSLRRGSCQSFAAAGDRLYFLENNMAYVGNRASTTLELVAKNLPPSQNSQLIPTNSNGLYAVLNNTLYRLDQTPQMLAANITDASWDEQTRTLIANDSHSLWIFNPETDQSPLLILRTSNEFSAPILNSFLKQILFLENNTIKTVETRAKFNHFIKEFKTPSPVNKFQISVDGSTLFWIGSNGNLYRMKIR